MLTNFRNGDWLLIDDVPTNEILSLKEEYSDEFVVAGQLGTYYICWNINENLLPANSNLSGEETEKAQAEIRYALSLIIDRNYIVEQITQGGQVPASSFVAMGLTNPDGTQFYHTAGSSEEFYGYYNVANEAFEKNYENALKILKKYYTFDDATGQFKDAPTLTYIYNTGDSNQAVGEYIQGAFSAIGIKVELTNQEWNSFLETRKNGDYSLARNGWLADYNDPITFLDMWTTNSGNNDIQFGKGTHKDLAVYELDLTEYGIDYKIKNATWEKTYDKLISEIKSCKNTETRYELMHLAEDLLMKTGCITPIYYYTDIFMIDDSVHGFYSNPLGYKYFMHTTINNAK
jgi:oligopeptide transport system substrate-binding protein